MSSLPNKVAVPAILLANDLASGEVVFRTVSGWSRDPAEAFVAKDQTAAESFAAEAQAAMARNEVVEAYLVDVAVGADGRAVPRHFRERFKVLGPSVRPDLGKQAEFQRF